MPRRTAHGVSATISDYDIGRDAVPSLVQRLSNTMGWGFSDSNTLEYALAYALIRSCADCCYSGLTRSKSHELTSSFRRVQGKEEH
ncbi:hypothetical protein B0T26DRAFT_509333 [Lasiosphaeria miniovina]|uniref:Uncharacterized protein n=1 Tax=Lasiosphaeria miniovina TaxID=1954250 RepID=A0AA39ZU10_9PEZI|nr:uncharacterized protein B0T26DRAFT_509333 [Lasiosphaeria miniovina]KAK0703711.1 hypothetical protein B0T26DRAFT_509333 [Lasiosphaeria miniovina]